ncbi:low temperature requirement protein A [Micromonospora sp. CPCC 206171]|uniref:low temperature requirement protein A n=1 Tax=Micromonospora sp. CPCC 206171 TaxID=3122405 RepID=UPI002FF07CD1
MTTAKGDEGLRRPGHGPQRATFLELFLDLAFVFALGRVSQRLVEDLTKERRILLPEVGQTALLVLALWLVWSLAAWVTSRYDPQRTAIQLIIVGVMFGCMLMAVAVDNAFSGRAPLFAGAYVAVQVGRPLALMLLLRGHEQWRIGLRIVCWHAVSAVLWIVGAILPMARVAVWTLALAFEYAGLALGWPTPGLGRSRIWQWAIAVEHLAERYRQFVLIAFGESILLTGVTFSGGALEAGRTVAFVVAFATTVLLWRIYFGRSGEALVPRIVGHPRRGRIVEFGIYTHLVVVAGIVTTAVGYELVIDHPSGHLDPAWLAVILGGPALFLAGRAAGEYAVVRRVPPSRLVGLLALAALAPALVRLSPLASGIAAAGVLAGIVVADMVRVWRRPGERPSPA